MGRAGLEPDTLTANTANGLGDSILSGGNQSGNISNDSALESLISDPRLSALVEVWNALPANIQAEILLLAHNAIEENAT